MEPGTFDWHQLKNNDPYPGGEYSPVSVARGAPADVEKLAA
jgi:hypothetical protein